MGAVVMAVGFVIIVSISLYISFYLTRIHNYKVYYLKVLLKKTYALGFEKGIIWMYENMHYRNIKEMHSNGIEIHETPIWERLDTIYDKNYADFLSRGIDLPRVLDREVDKLLEEERRSINLSQESKNAVRYELLRFKN